MAFFINQIKKKKENNYQLQTLQLFKSNQFLIIYYISVSINNTIFFNHFEFHFLTINKMSFLPKISRQNLPSKQTEQKQKSESFSQRHSLSEQELGGQQNELKISKQSNNHNSLYQIQLTQQQIQTKRKYYKKKLSQTINKTLITKNKVVAKKNERFEHLQNIERVYARRWDVGGTQFQKMIDKIFLDQQVSIDRIEREIAKLNQKIEIMLIQHQSLEEEIENLDNIYAPPQFLNRKKLKLLILKKQQQQQKNKEALIEEEQIIERISQQSNPKPQEDYRKGSISRSLRKTHRNIRQINEKSIIK